MDIAIMEDEIDQMGYMRYGLVPDEIATVEAAGMISINVIDKFQDLYAANAYAVPMLTLLMTKWHFRREIILLPKSSGRMRF